AGNFFGARGGVGVNGFAMGARLGEVHAVIAEKFRQLHSVFSRVAAGWRLGQAGDVVGQAARQTEAKRHEEQAVLEYLRTQRPAIETVLKLLLESSGHRDAFGLLPALRNLAEAIASGHGDAA